MMTNQQWFKDAIIYQAYPMSFQDSNGDGVGDLKGIEERLPYIKKLGCNFIWLNPIFKSPNEDNGYDVADYEKIQPQYGTMQDFDELLHKMHQMGLHLMMDMVFNHTSDQHPWFKQSKQSRNNKYSNYYIWRDPVNGHQPNNWLSIFNEPAWTYVPQRKQYYLHCFAKGQPDLNWDNPQVRHELYNVLRFWIKKGVDGFRFDAIDFISKPKGMPNAPKQSGQKYSDLGPVVKNGPKEGQYIKEMFDHVLSKHHLVTVGEMSSATLKNAAKYANLKGGGFNMVFQFQHVGLAPNPDHRLNKWNDQPIKLVDLKHVLSRWQEGLNGKSWNSLYWNNHDQPRAVSRFVNHADGPKYRVRAAKMLGTTLHMMQGTPYVYEGEELGMTNVHYTKLSQYEDIDTRNAYHQFVDEDHIVDPKTMLKYMSHISRDNARTPMQWTAGKNAGFTTGKPWFALNPNYKQINAKQEVRDPRSVFNYYRKLIALRKRYAIIRYGDYKELDPSDDRVFAYLRHYQGQTLLVMNNFTKQSVTRDYHQDRADQLLIGNYPDDQGTTLRPFESKVYLFKK